MITRLSIPSGLRRLPPSLVCLMLLAGGAAAQAPARPSLTTQLDALVSPHFRPGAPGAAVLVRKGDQILLRKGYGIGDLGAAAPVRPEQVFRLGSITKQFTSAAIMLLADEGKLSLRDDIRKHLPTYPTHGATITIEHLLTHTSGIPSYTDQPDFPRRMAEDIEPPDLLRLFKDRPLEFKPGERMKYSNSGYHLLGLIIEKASGKSYADFMRDRFWKPLGMKSTGYGDDPRLARVRGYERAPGSDGAVRPAAVINMKIPYSAGALVSSVDDMAVWDAAIRDGKLLAPKSWQAIFSPGRLADGSRTGYGYGWTIGKLDGRPAHSHGGGIPGFATHLLRMPEEKLLVVVLFNSIPPPTDAGMLAHKLALTALGKPYVEPKVARIDPALLDRYVGVYRASSPGAVPLFIRRDGDHLTLQPAGGRRMDAWPESETRFFVKDRLTRLAFVTDGRDRTSPATGAELTKSNGDVERVARTTEKLPSERPIIMVAPEHLQRYVGEYALSPEFKIAITREGSQIFAQATNQPRLEIFPTAPHTFFLRAVEAELTFESKGNDPAHQLTLDQNGRKQVGKRVR